MKAAHRLAAILAIILLPVLALVSWWTYSAWWWRTAEAKAITSIAAARSGRSYADADVTVTGLQRNELGTRYELVGEDNYPRGDSILDMLSPGVLVAHAVARDGKELHVETWLEGGRWRVSIEPAEGT